MMIVGLQFRLLWLCMICFFSRGNAWANPDFPAEPALIAGISAQSFPDVSVTDIEVTLKLLAEELGKSSGYNTVVTAYTDDELLRQDFEQGKINFVVASSLILATEYDQTLFADGFRFIRASQFPDQLLIVGQQRYELAAFRGKRVLLAQHDPMSELYMDYFAWKTFKQGYKSTFKVLPPSEKVNQLLLQVFFDKADLVGVYQNFYETALELNPQLQSRLKVVSQMDNIPVSGAFFRKDTPLEFREIVINDALNMANKSRGKQLMEMFKCDRILRSGPEDLLPAKKLFDARHRMAAGQ